VPLHTATGAGCSCGKAACGTGAGKHPRISRWHERATTDSAQASAWWHEWPEANIGIVLGRRAGIVVLDIDPRNGGDDTLYGLERAYGALPRTPSAKSGGGGSHFYFVAPTVRLGPTIGDGLDLLGDGKLVAAPPSVHASGNVYEWDEHPDDVELAVLPEWMLRAATPLKRPRGRSLDVIRQGGRNVALTQIAGRMRLVLAQGEAIAPALHAINQARCKPPLPAAEVEDIARSAQRWDSPHWLTSPRKFFGDPRLSSSARHVLRAICEHAKADGTARPSFQALIDLTGLKSPTTIDRRIQELEAADRIEVQRRPMRVSVYRVLPWPGTL
jgi:hypothetical protein